MDLWERGQAGYLKNFLHRKFSSFLIYYACAYVCVIIKLIYVNILLLWFILQELDNEDFYKGNMQTDGYSSIYIQRSGQKRDGCGIFYKHNWYAESSLVLIQDRQITSIKCFVDLIEKIFTFVESFACKSLKCVNYIIEFD